MAPKKSRKRKAPDAGEDGSSKKRVAILQDSAPSHAALFSDTSISPPATSPEESTGVATTLPGLSDLDYTPNKWDSPHLHRYFELLQDGHFKMKSGATAKYTAPTPKSEHVLDLPAVEGRNFTLVEDAICLVNQDQPDGTTIKVWKIPIRNMTAEELQFDAFMVPGWATPLKCPSCKKKQVKCNKKRPCDKCSKDPVDAAECVKAKHEVADHRWLTESACSSENISKIVQLGQLVAQILNRVPFEPDVDIWTGRRQPDVRALVPPQKRFVELVSIIEWKRRHFQELDFDRIPPHPAPWSDKTHTYRFFGRAAFGGPPVLQWRKQSYGTQPRSLIWSGKDGQHANFLTLSPANFDASQRETPSEDHLDDYQFFGQYFDGAPDDCNNKDLVTEAKTDSKTASMLRAFQQGLFALVGHVGEWTAINSTWHEHTSAYQSKAGTKGAMLDGPLNGGLLLKKPNAITNALYFGQSWHALLAKPFTHAAIPKVDDRACLSYAMSTTLDAFEAGKSFPWITFTLYRALYELESGIVTRDMVIEQALTSFDSADPDNASRWAICMHCLKSIARDRLCWIETIKGPLLCCRSCSNSSYALKTFSNRPNLFDTLRRRCEQIFKSDSLFTTPDWTPNELSATLHQNHQVPGEVVKYIHGFTALPMDLYTQSAIYLRPEIEKVHQRYGDQLHSPHNITLVPSCLNKLHLTGAISLLPVVKNAMVLGLKEQELGRLRPRYHPDLEAEWAANEAAQDHQRIVCSLTPSNTKLRMRQERSPEIDQRIREMEKSGVWDGDLVPFVKGLFQTKSSRIQSPHWPVENMWQDTRWKELVALIKEMQGSKDWNPESNDIVWIGPQQDLPWFWREDHAPTDVDRE
ncbi:hypothetical protein CB0940_02845 [Cercospora beticola]|uniref:Zn(2)-C6 fungal-type domain-containing protein n=1 Tax=Cercospora beticola TaxID=122368 RepID=A0A2G5I4F2_CERBT|nr:hypothetical protein CB0940_02845 [Cercospora beticola]PIA99689.1 hypothetical protein CB0940_02845 [Cercospora beticola]WPA99995.1 hypothetical protein RHO25_004615 [Cercospora beticola]CAK1361827.1 unnamed protein product [Cercospora beticola]